MSQRTILHVDLNSFFATCEQQINPHLRGKPVGILKAEGRTCVIAASVEAKQFGVKTGTSAFEAKKLCPQIILVPADFSKYADVSYRFIDICQSYSPTCEAFSLDECFIDVTETEWLFRDLPFDAPLDQVAMYDMFLDLAGKQGVGAVNIVFEIKKRLREEIGEWMRCSAGISYNRVCAKLAGEQIKPDGIFWIRRENVLQILDKSEFMDVCGIGWGLNSHLERVGIKNFKQLRSCSIPYLKQHFGPFWSVHLYNICRGIDDTIVNSFRELADAKSVGRTYTTHRTIYRRDEMYRLIRNLCEEAATKARRMGLAGRYVALSLRGPASSNRHSGKRGQRAHPESSLLDSGVVLQSSTPQNDTSSWGSRKNDDENSWYGHRTLKTYIDDGKKFFEICRQISTSWFDPSSYSELVLESKRFGVRFFGVTLGMMVKKEQLSIPFFGEDRRREKLVGALDKVNEMYGDYSVFPGQLLGMSIVMPEVNGYFGDRKYRLDFLRTS